MVEQTQQQGQGTDIDPSLQYQLVDISTMLGEKGLVDTPENRRLLIADADTDVAGLDGLEVGYQKELNDKFSKVRTEARGIALQLAEYQMRAADIERRQQEFTAMKTIGNHDLTTAQIAEQEKQFAAEIEANDAFYHKLTHGMYDPLNNQNIIWIGNSGVGKSHAKEAWYRRELAYGIVDNVLLLSVTDSAFDKGTENLWTQIYNKATDNGTKRGLVVLEDGLARILENTNCGQIARAINTRLDKRNGHFMFWVDAYEMEDATKFLRLDKGLPRRMKIINYADPDIETLMRAFARQLRNTGISFDTETADTQLVEHIKKVLGEGMANPNWHHNDSAVELANKTAELAQDRVNNSGQSWRLLDDSQKIITLVDVARFSPDRSQLLVISPEAYAKETAGNNNRPSGAVRDRRSTMALAANM